MYQLIMVVSAIALMAAMAASSVVYSPISAFERQRALTTAQKGFVQLERATLRYLNANRFEETGEPIYVGDGENLHSITPEYGFMPPAPKGFSWRIETGQYVGDSVGICLAANSAKAETYDPVFRSLRTQLGEQATSRGSSCHSGSYNAEGAALTFWVALSHIAPLPLLRDDLNPAEYSDFIDVDETP